MAEDKPFNTGVEDVAKYENEERRQTYSPEHGSGNPHLQPGELCESGVWKSHKSSLATKEQKSHGTVKPPKKQA